MHAEHPEFKLQKDVKNVELYLIFVWKTHKQLMKINKRELSVCQRDELEFGNIFKIITFTKEFYGI